MAKRLTATKASEILHDGTVHGKAITDKQRRFFGAVSSGQAPRRNAAMAGLKRARRR